MGRFDWAGEGCFSTAGWTDDDWRAFRVKFNHTSREEREELIAALQDETADMARRKAAIDWVVAVLRMVMHFDAPI